MQLFYSATIRKWTELQSQPVGKEESEWRLFETDYNWSEGEKCLLEKSQWKMEAG